MHTRAQRSKKAGGARSASCMDMATLQSHKVTQSALQEKLIALLAMQSRPFDIYQAIIEAATTSLLKLQVPETLIVSGPQSKELFIHTDKDGVVRVDKEALAAHDFFASVVEKGKQLSNINPQGIHIPKMITFIDSHAESLLHHKADFRRFVSAPDGRTRRLQHFVCPYNFLVRDTILRWRRTKMSKCYYVTSRVPLKPSTKKPPAGSDYLDTSYLSSLKYSKNCDVAKVRISEEMTQVLESVRDVINRFVVTSAEQLEELFVTTIKSQDEKLYFVDVLAARVSVVEEEQPFTPKHCHGLSELLHSCDESNRLKDKLLPYLNLSDMTETSEKLFQLQLSSARSESSQSDSQRLRSDSEQLLSQHLSEVSAHLDSLVKESQELKREFGIVMKVQLSKYPKGLLELVIRRVYEQILRDPRLSKYYPDKARIFERLLAAVKSVFLNGLSRHIRARMRLVHMGMGITDADFDLYVRYFTEAMQALNVAEDDVGQTREFLNEFRSDVVQRLLNQTEAPSNVTSPS